MTPGDKFNRLEAVRFHHKKPDRHAHWFFRCDCGAEKSLDAVDVKRGKVKSCGCLNASLKGASRHPLYNTWRMMIRRCYDFKSKDFPTYGKIGIAVCEGWLNSFWNFLEDISRLGPRPHKCTLDRIHPNGSYGPDNVRWATKKVQAQNQRRYLEVGSDCDISTPPPVNSAEDVVPF